MSKEVEEQGQSLKRSQSILRSSLLAQVCIRWEEHVVVGSMVHCPWVSSQKLGTSIQVAAELWSLISRNPGESSIIVAGDDHLALPLTGQELPKLKALRQITLYPSRYRLMEVVSG